MICITGYVRLVSYVGYVYVRSLRSPPPHVYGCSLILHFTIYLTTFCSLVTVDYVTLVVDSPFGTFPVTLLLRLRLRSTTFTLFRSRSFVVTLPFTLLVVVAVGGLRLLLLRYCYFLRLRYVRYVLRLFLVPLFYRFVDSFVVVGWFVPARSLFVVTLVTFGSLVGLRYVYVPGCWLRLPVTFAFPGSFVVVLCLYLYVRCLLRLRYVYVGYAFGWFVAFVALLRLILPRTFVTLHLRYGSRSTFVLPVYHHVRITTFIFRYIYVLVVTFLSFRLRSFFLFAVVHGWFSYPVGSAVCITTFTPPHHHVVILLRYPV